MNYQSHSHKKIIEVMVKLINLDKDEEKKASEIIKEIGIKAFFDNLESLDLSSEALNKLLELRTIIQAAGGGQVDASFIVEGDASNE